jgi:MoaA/NifB/PqqE/SkfB family radical SAM enzyme
VNNTLNEVSGSLDIAEEKINEIKAIEIGKKIQNETKKDLKDHQLSVQLQDT